MCEICGDEVGLTVDGDLFVACNECGFPVCRPCYEYERREGTQNCPQCKTRYKRIKGTTSMQATQPFLFIYLENVVNIGFNEAAKNQSVCSSLVLK